MNLNEAIKATALGKKVTTGGPTPTTGGATPDSVTPTPEKAKHYKNAENQLYRIDNADTEAPEGEAIDELSNDKLNAYDDKARKNHNDAWDKETELHKSGKTLKDKEVQDLHKVINKRIVGVNMALKKRRAKEAATNEEAIDEAQFIVLKKGGTTKRIRNNPEEIERAKAAGWVVAATVTESEYNKDAVDKEISKDKRIKSKEATLIQRLLKGRTEKKANEQVEYTDEGFELQKKYTNPSTKHSAHVLFNSGDQSYKVKVNKDGTFQSDLQHTTRDKEDAHIHAKKAIKMKNEETEKINELSKKKLGDYVSSASRDAADSTHEIGKVNGIAATVGTSAADRKHRDEHNKRQSNRQSGIHAALKKLTKEDILDMSVEDAKAILEDVATKRGRPTKSSAEGAEHIMVGLRKAISLKGEHPVRFGNGDSHKVSVNHAANILQKHDAFQKPSEKMAFAQRISASHDALKKAVSSVAKSEKPKEEPSKEGAKPTKAITVKIDK